MMIKFTLTETATEDRPENKHVFILPRSGEEVSDPDAIPAQNLVDLIAMVSNLEVELDQFKIPYDVEVETTW